MLTNANKAPNPSGAASTRNVAHPHRVRAARQLALQLGFPQSRHDPSIGGPSVRGGPILTCSPPCLGAMRYLVL